ncbi:ammonium transporter [Pleurocapsales cyanobacterium LEGE 10410]|nr:ammonium transporter [Pleurocapsales cyanobacterium LEGE 10410]
MNSNYLWLIFSTFLVFLMQPGFMCLESGLTRSKNSINVAIKNLIDFSISVILFWAVGYGMAFGTSIAGIVGSDHFFFNPESVSPRGIIFFIFEMMFCSTAATIVSGATAERLRFRSYAIVTIIISGLIYPSFSHWVWNSSGLSDSLGYLENIGFIDFAGSTVVHSLGGWVALAVIVVVGSRTGRFDRSGKPRHIHGSNLPFSVLGVMLIWLGWLGFNGGSVLALTSNVASIILNTILAGAAGTICAGLISWHRSKTYKVEVLINGSLAGLVAITASCNAVSAPLAIVIGSIGGIISILVSYWLRCWQIDDAVDAIPVHLGGGIWGTIAVALYANPEVLNTGLSRTNQLLVQLLGITICGVWAFGITWVLLKVINRLTPLRVSLADEERGLNISEHYAKNTVYEMLRIMNRQAAERDLSLRVPVEPFTEIGHVANRYNQVIDSLEESTQQLKQFNVELEQKVQQRTAELSIAKEKAEVANHAKSVFIANMSHELRTPLNAILGFTQLMSRNDAIPAEEQKHLDIISSSGEHLLSLINDVLDLSKIEAQRLPLEEVNFDLCSLLDSLEQMFSLKANQKNLHILFETSPATPQYIKTDLNKLRQILINLLNNAVKFTSQGGVTLRVSPVSNSCSHNEPGTRLKLIFAVEDTGRGIAADEIDTLFEPFAQTQAGREADEGTGLGLAISRKFVRLMGGDIQVYSKENQGSIFQFDLLVQIAAVEQLPASNHQQILRLEPNQPQRRILVVDDKIYNRELLIKLLQPVGFQTRSAANGFQAISLWQQWQPDLVLLDIKMPTMNGLKIIQHLKGDRLSKTKIIALTASAFEEEREAILAAGCDDFMRKPFNANELLLMMTKHLGLCYTCAEAANSPEQQTLLSPLDGDSFASISNELLLELQQSIMEIDLEKIEQIIQKIAQENQLLAQKIERHIENFDYEYILNLLGKNNIL